MSNTTEKILVKISPVVIGKNAAEFLAELVSYGVFTDEEYRLIDAKVLHAEKFMEIFSKLKPKSEDTVFPVLQKACMKLKWRSVLHLLQSTLRLEKMERLIVADAELQAAHDIFKHALPKTRMRFVGRNHYLTKIHDLIENYKVAVENNMSNLIKIAVTGLGGVGKTQLVTQFVAKYQLEYDSVIWINAESYNTATVSFTNLGHDLDTLQEKMDMSTYVKKIYGKLSRLHSRNLIIFDNADDFIPDQFWFDDLDNFVLIITSRNRKWPYFEIVDVGVFPHNEASEFVKKSLFVENYDSEDDIVDLIKELQFFPLALQQAVAYIKQSHEEEKICSSRFTIKDYLTEYDMQRKSLLDYPLHDEKNQVNFQTTLNTWQVTVAKLCRLAGKSVSNEAKEVLPFLILNLISFLDGEQIDPMYFLQLTDNNDKGSLGWAILKLEQYSMVNKIEQEKRTFFSVHKLIQEVTRIRLQDDNQELNTFECVCIIMSLQSPGTKNSLQDLVKFKELLPHFNSLKRVMDKSTYLVVNVQELHVVLYHMQKCYGHFGNYVLQLSCLLKCLLVIQTTFGFGTVNVAPMLYFTAIAIWHLGHPKTSIILMKRSLSISGQSDPLGTEILADLYSEIGNNKKHMQLMEESIYAQKLNNSMCTEHVLSLKNEAAACSKRGDTKRKKELLENVLEIEVERHGAEHPIVAKTLCMLGLACGELGDKKRQFTLFERALQIQENHFGYDSIEIASTLGCICNQSIQFVDCERRKMLLERLVKVQESYHLPSSDILIPDALAALGVTNCELGETQEGIGLLERAIIIYEKYFGSMYIKIADVVNNLGLSYRNNGDIMKGKACFERALNIKENAFGSNHIEISDCLLKLSSIYLKLRDYETKNMLFERALKIQQAHYGIANIDLISTLHDLHVVHENLRNVAIAKTYLQLSFTIQKQYYGNDDWRTIWTQFKLEMSDGDDNPETLNKYLTSLKQSFTENDPLILTGLELLANLYGLKGDYLKQSQVMFERYQLQYPHEDCHIS